MKTPLTISKTDFLLYMDSPRHLWAYKRGLADQGKIDIFIQHLFEQGKEVQQLARKFVIDHLIPNNYPNGAEYKFEVTQTDNAFEARIDLMIFDHITDLWDIYEIKSSRKVKIEHVIDLTFQKLIFDKHLKIGRSFILHLNPDYVRNGPLNYAELFVTTDISLSVEEQSNEVDNRRYEAVEIINSESIEQAEGCVKPRTCPCLELCHPNLPDPSIYDVVDANSKIRRTRYLEENYSKSLLDIPPDTVLGKDLEYTPRQRLQIDSAQRGTTHIDKVQIQEHLSTLVYPLYFLDYESFSPAIPIYDRYTTFDQMPFQYSLHIKEHEDSDVIHKDFLEINKVDSSYKLLQQLTKDIGDDGSIVIWSKYEITQNNAMIRRYPEFTEFLTSVNERSWDLMTPFHKLWYYDPAFKGRYSIKVVLPLLVPELTYKEMEIADGATAMIRWAQMVYGGGKTVGFSGDENGDVKGAVDIQDLDRSEDKSKIRENLLRYCELDTLAMVKLHEVLIELTK